MNSPALPFVLQKGSEITINAYSFNPYLILDKYNQIFWPATEYLRYIGERGIDQKSIYNDATRLCKFLTWVYTNNITYEGVTDEVLISYKKHLGSFEATTLSAYLRTIIQFYAVCQELRFIEKHIGQSSFEEPERYKIHITYNNKKQAAYNKITWMYAPKVRSNAPDVPTTAEIDLLIDSIINTDTDHDLSLELRQRDYLMVCWLRDAFLREAEVVGLSITSIPSRATLLDDIVGGELSMSRTPITIKKGAKYSKERVVHVPTALVLETLDFISNDRIEIVESTGYRTSTALFPSAESGDFLTPNYVWHLLKGYCKPINVNIHPHKLRKYGITKLIYLRIIAAEDKNGGTHSKASVVFEVSQMAGHSNTKTTEKYYIDLKKMGGFYDRNKLSQQLKDVNLFQNNQILLEQVKLLESRNILLTKKLKRLQNRVKHKL